MAEGEVNITAFDDAGVLNGTEKLYVVRGTTDYNTTPDAIKTRVKGDIVNDLTTGGATKFALAETVKTLNTAKAPLANPIFTGNVVIPDGDAANEAVSKGQMDTADALIYTDIYNVTGAVSHYKRVLADAGGVLDRTWLLRAYEEYIKQRPETLRLYIPELGAKLRTSGLNRFGVKAYDMSANAKDAVQLTDATQPYMTVGAAPNARLGMRFVQGQTQTGLMDFDDVVFAAGDSWTLTKRVKINSKGTGRVYLGAAWIETTATTVVLNSGTVAVLTGTYNFEAGRTYTIEFQYSNGVGLILVNGLPIATTPLSGAVTFGQISYSTTYPADREIYAYHLITGRKSAYQSALDHTFLSTIFPDMESVAIGNQVWATSNFEGTVAGDGTVIPEVQGATTDGNAEILPALNFTSGWMATAGVTVVDADTITIATSGGVHRILLIAGKAYRVTIAGTTTAQLFIRSSQVPVVYKTIEIGAFSETIYLLSKDTSIYLYLTAAGQLDVTSLSIKEVGASDSTLVYNYIYAATTGTAAVKDLAATKAAAMWCHYDNSAANGAVYGKLYNWYAVHLFDLYPPVKGWRVPSKLDFDQLVAYNGGSTVAGGRLKVAGNDFFRANVGANNESGLSLIGAGERRATDSVFYGKNQFGHNWTSDNYDYYVVYAEAGVSSRVDDKRTAYPLRLLRNEPAGLNELSYTSGLFTTDITSVPKQIPISFGRIVNAIRIKSENALTAVEAKLYNVAGTAVATLITTKTVAAGATMMFPVIADYAGLLQDGSVRVTAAGNSGAAVGMEIEVLTHKGVLS